MLLVTVLWIQWNLHNTDTIQTLGPYQTPYYRLVLSSEVVQATPLNQ